MSPANVFVLPNFPSLGNGFKNQSRGRIKKEKKAIKLILSLVKISDKPVKLLNYMEQIL